MKKLFYLVILGAGIIGCTTDPVDPTPENAIDQLNFTFEASGFDVVSYDFYTGNERNPVYKGTMNVSQDCNNLFVAITGEPDEVNLGIFNEGEDPELKRNGTVHHAQLPHDLDSATDYVWVFPLSDFSSETIKIFARSWNDWAGEEEFADANYFTYTLETCDEVCSYGYGYWKNHGPDAPGDQDYMWPIEEDETLMLGEEDFTTEELQEILKEPVHGDELISLMHHLITAKFNLLIGVDGTEISGSIDEADNILSANGDGWSKDEINEIKDLLEDWTEANKCDEDEE